MRVTSYSRTEHGCAYTVAISYRDVMAFNACWPGSDLKVKNYWVQFETNGDLVDHNVSCGAEAAIAAIISDAQKYACDQLNLDHYAIRYA